MHGQTPRWLLVTSASHQLPVPNVASLGRRPGHRMARTARTFAAPAGRRTSRSAPRTPRRVVEAEAEVDTEAAADDEIEAVAFFPPRVGNWAIKPVGARSA